MIEAHQQWFVVQTKPRKESVASENLERQGYTAYCPKITISKRRKQRWCQIVEPLFPRYLFVKLEVGEDDFSPIRSTLGVQNLVRFGEKTAVMPEQVIEAIRSQEHCFLDQCANHPDWKAGDTVEIIEGPFAGLKGVFQTKNGEERAIVLLKLLGRDSCVSVNVDTLASRPTHEK
jgi:transcriptional antiterminator RfaH